MGWNENGKTFRRFDIDQGVVTPAWAAAQIRVPFQALKQAGFLRRLLLQIPYTGYPTAFAGTTTVALASTEPDWPAHRAIANFSLVLQRVAPIYNLNRGIDLAILEYMNCGNTYRSNQAGLGSMSALTSTNTMVFGKSSSVWAYISNVVSIITGNASTSVTLGFGLSVDIPLTEMIKFPAGVVQDKSGNAVSVPETYGEVGLVTLQNSQQNVVPSLLLNPWCTATAGVNQLFVSNTAAPTNGQAAPVNLWSEFYDVPENPADWPPGYAFDYIIQYQSFDDPVSGGKVTHKFDNAGLLMRAAYVALSSADAIVDISQLSTNSSTGVNGTDGTIAFKWGSSVLHRNSNFQTNMTEALQRYSNPPPRGVLIHDFFQDNQSTVDMINTAIITSPRCEIVGLPNTVATLHTIEQRMIPVMVRQG
ncbi:MAG: hypothetical protein C5B59_13685 [Bacteroidetes bacterium]|nr:MAG: hypothetical protein C5B59_13685 [Bacteroidota bacterium]